jgi:ribosome-binding factor A
MAREFGRSERVSSQIQKDLALVLQRCIKAPRLGFVTVNEVNVSRDLAVAKVYITVLNANQQQIEENIELLNEAAPYLRREVATRMKMRHMPELRFYYDDSIDTGMRVSALLKGLEEEKPLQDEE